MELPCYVISLRTSTRRQQIAADLKNLQLRFDFVDGIESATLSIDDVYDDRRFRQRYGRSATPSEIASVLAHQRAYRRIVDDGVPVAAVLEDDAILRPGFPAVVDAAAAQLRPGDIALLERRGEVTAARLGRVQLPDGHNLVFLHRHAPWGAVATIVTNSAARSLSAFATPVRSAPDDWGLFSSRVVVRAVVPPVASHDEGRPSEIGASRFHQPLAPPRLSERLRWHARRSPIWQSRPSLRLREIGLLARAAVVRARAGSR